MKYWSQNDRRKSFLKREKTTGKRNIGTDKMCFMQCFNRFRFEEEKNAC